MSSVVLLVGEFIKPRSGRNVPQFVILTIIMLFSYCVQTEVQAGEANKSFQNVTKFEHFRPVETDKNFVVLANTKTD